MQFDIIKNFKNFRQGRISDLIREASLRKRVQELQTEIEEIKKANKELKDEIDKINAQIELEFQLIPYEGGLFEEAKRNFECNHNEPPLPIKMKTFSSSCGSAKNVFPERDDGDAESVWDFSF